MLQSVNAQDKIKNTIKKRENALKSNFTQLVLLLFSIVQVTSVHADDLLDKKINTEEKYAHHKFILNSHRQNYLLPFTYNFNPNNIPNEGLKARGIDTGLDRVMRVEAKFQLSFKFPVAKSLFSDNDRIWAAYTQQSYWQVYNQNSSRPFRENNYEPEVIYTLPTNFSLSQLKLDLFEVGFVHQSNGQTENLSRSWNRIYLSFLFNYKENWAFVLRPWHRFSDGPKDDNPDLKKYMGIFDLRIIHKLEYITMQLLLRNSFEHKGKGFREFSLSFPLDDKIKGLLQYSNGYGESLLDYRAHINRIGLGITISDLL